MTIREIPRAFVYECDGCGLEHKQENAGGHYTDSRPDGWGRVTLKYAANFELERLLCPKCLTRVKDAIDEATEKA